MQELRLEQVLLTGSLKYAELDGCQEETEQADEICGERQDRKKTR